MPSKNFTIQKQLQQLNSSIKGACEEATRCSRPPLMPGISICFLEGVNLPKNPPQCSRSRKNLHSCIKSCGNLNIHLFVSVAESSLKTSRVDLQVSPFSIEAHKDMEKTVSSALKKIIFHIQAAALNRKKRFCVMPNIHCCLNHIGGHTTNQMSAFLLSFVLFEGALWGFR